MRRARSLLASVGLAALLATCGAPPAYAANLTPAGLTPAASASSGDLFLIWPAAGPGPLESMTWTVLKAQIASGLGSTWLLPANNLSDLANATTARTNLGLGSAAVAFTGTSGATLGFLNGANTISGANSYSALQTFSSVTVSGGVIDGTIIGSSTAAAGFFTNLTTTGNSALGDGNPDTTTITGQLDVLGTSLAAGISSCGVSPAVAPGAAANDARGSIRNGTGSVTTCTVAFSRTRAHQPSCVVSLEGSTAATIAVDTVTTSSLVVRFSSSYNGGWAYVCVG